MGKFGFPQPGLLSGLMMMPQVYFPVSPAFRKHPSFRLFEER
ncbi:hypothetical protein [Bradyrhizobium australiense]|nr:hypothetical protein [Bradyrhizobium australiense]